MHEIIDNDIKNIIDSINFKCLKNKSILITGASGLLGIYLMGCLKELHKKLNITVYSWTKTSIPDNFKYFFDFNCHKIIGDISDISIYKKLPYFDFIIHAAGYGQPGKFLENKLRTIQINTTATVELLSKLHTKGKFLFISTSELYSGLNKLNIAEDEIGITNTDHPRASYIEGKRCGEAVCHSFNSDSHQVKIARLSLAYGPGTKMDDQRVLNSLINKAMNNDYIELMDQGAAIRTYCYVSDIVEMLWNILFLGKSTVYNVGGHSKITILELAKRIGKLFDKKVKIPAKGKSLLGSPKTVNISIKRYMDEFKKTSFIDIQEGLARTIQWQKENYGK